MASHIFSGSSCELLTPQIAKKLHVKPGKLAIQRFANSECKITIEEKVVGDTCIVVQSTGNPTDANIIELILLCDALKRSEASSVIGVIPYLSYARQDRQHAPGECVSINIIAQLLETVGFNKLYTVNIHSESSSGIFTIPFKNIDATPFLAQKAYLYLKKNKIIKSSSELVIVAPDHGAIIQAREFALAIDPKNPPNIAVVDKERLRKNGKVMTHGLYGDVSGKVAILVDDVIVSGSTLLQSTNLCIDLRAHSVYSAVIHQDLVDSTVPNLETSKITKLFTTNTIRSQYNSDKIIEFSVAELLSKELKIYR